jgi:hypothetical protein
MTLFELGSLSLSVAKPTSRNKPQTKCQKADVRWARVPSLSASGFPRSFTVALESPEAAGPVVSYKQTLQQFLSSYLALLYRASRIPLQTPQTPLIVLFSLFSHRLVSHKLGIWHTLPCWPQRSRCVCASSRTSLQCNSNILWVLLSCF